MKNLIKTAMAMFALLLFASACDSGVDMQPLLDDFNKQCPIELIREKGEIQSVSATFADNVLVINNEILKPIGDSIAEDVKIINAIGDEPLKQVCLAGLQDNAAFKALMKAADENGIKVKVNFTEKANDLSKNIDLPAADVKAAADGTLNLDRAMVKLQMVLKVANASFPLQDEGLTFNGIMLDDKEVVLNITVDEKQVPISALQSAAGQLKKEMNPKTNKDWKDMVQICVDAGCGFKFILIGNKSDKRVEIAYTVDEMK